jgi:hypothetical protein
MAQTEISRRRKQKVFISYAREDTQLAKQLAEQLRASGLEPWLDLEELHAGENWASASGRALESSDVIVALVSKSFSRSHHLQREWNFAIGSKKHAGRVLPVLTPGTPIDVAPWIAKHIQHFKGPDWEKTSERVAKAVQQLAEAPSRLASQTPG